MVDDKLFLIIVSTSLLAFLIRFLPVWLLQGQRLTGHLYHFLRNLPIAVLAALVAQSIFVKEGTICSGWQDYYLLGLLTSITLATITRNLAVIIFGSLMVLSLLKLLLP
jgi:branched-subunit amino acid transport protein